MSSSIVDVAADENVNNLITTYDPTTEDHLKNLRFQRLNAAKANNFEIAMSLQVQEQQILLTGATLLRIRSEWNQAIVEERYDDCTKYKQLSIAQRDLQQSYMNPSFTTTVLKSKQRYDDLPPPPQKVISSWNIHCEGLKHRNPTINKQALENLCRDYRKSKEHGYGQIFILHIEQILGRDFDLIKPILLELESEMIVQEMRKE